MVLLRVIISPQEVRRVTLQDVPESIEELSRELRTALGVRGHFKIQFKDPFFDNELTDLTNINDLPPERATLQLVFTEDSSEMRLDSIISYDPILGGTDQLQSSASGSQSSARGSQSSTSGSQSRTSGSGTWPHPFVVPNFCHDVEVKLREGNEKYAQHGTVLVQSKALKSEILTRLCDEITKITCYPQGELEMVAKALVAKHPCLGEPSLGDGTVSAWSGWLYSLKSKVANARTHGGLSNHPEVVVNKRKGSQKGGLIKKSKKGELHFLPAPPDGQTKEKTENDRITLCHEMQKMTPDSNLLDELMSATFSKRRQEIIGDEPLITTVQERWPALFTERALCAEFNRIVSKDLLASFMGALDVLTPTLLEVYKTSASSIKKADLANVLRCLQKEDTNQNRRAAALYGLPCYLAEDSSSVIRFCDADGETVDVLMTGMACGMLIGHEGPLDDTFPLEVVTVALVVEEKAIVTNIRDVPTAFALLIAVIYSLNLEYPVCMKRSFEFVQKVVMELDPNTCSCKVRGLKNKLMGC